eukprot:2839740-Amphidinium_carterae.2
MWKGIKPADAQSLWALGSTHSLYFVRKHQPPSVTQQSVQPLPQQHLPPRQRCGMVATGRTHVYTLAAIALGTGCECAQKRKRAIGAKLLGQIVLR